MNTPIIKISDDQNEIIHESGVVTVFEENETCEGCIYDIGNYCAEENKIPCYPYQRTDHKPGIFKLKHNADTI